MPTEPVDLFADAFRLYIGAFGCAIHFSLSDPDQQVVTAPGAHLPDNRIATIRLTPELMKGLAFIMRRQIIAYEQSGNPRIELPPNYMSAALAGADLESWNRCWEYTQ